MPLTWLKCVYRAGVADNGSIELLRLFNILIRSCLCVSSSVYLHVTTVIGSFILQLGCHVALCDIIKRAYTNRYHL